MALRLITPASATPVTLAEAKNICRIDGTDHDDQLTMIVGAVTTELEQLLNRSLVSATWELAIDRFPNGEIALGKPDVSAITSVKYVSGDAENTLASDQYALDTASEYESWLFPVESWPSTDDAANAVKVRFTAGYGDADDVPEPLKLWILLKVKAIFFSEEFSTYINGMIEPYKVY